MGTSGDVRLALQSCDWPAWEEELFLQCSGTNEDLARLHRSTLSIACDTEEVETRELVRRSTQQEKRRKERERRGAERDRCLLRLVRATVRALSAKALPRP